MGDDAEGPLAGRPICGIIVSHYHADHVGFAGNLAKLTGAPVYMGAVEHQQASWGLAQSDEHAGFLLAQTYAQFGLSDEVVNRVQQEGNYYLKLSGDLPDVTIIDTDHRFETKSGCWLTRLIPYSPGQMSLSDFDRKYISVLIFYCPYLAKYFGLPRSIEVDMGYYYKYLVDAHFDEEWLIIPGHDWPILGELSAPLN